MASQTKNISITKTTHSKIDTVDFNNLPFGSIYSDHVMICDFENGVWSEPRIEPYGPITLDPAAKIFHYGQSIFEGMKAYRDDQDQVWLFRPTDNHARLNKSASRLAMPEIPQAYFMEGLMALLELEKDWIPKQLGSSLYLRPYMFASGIGFHASPADKYRFMIACAPSGPYFSGKVKVLIEQTYARAANGGVGFAKAGGNYAAQFYPTKLATEKGYQQVIWTDDNTHEFIEEAGAMNIFVRINDTLLTAPTNDRILDGITRKSILAIAEDEGITTEVRKIKVSEIVAAAENGSLKEMFGAGTAAVVSPIAGFGYQDNDYDLPELTDSFADRLKKRITDIQYNKAEDKFGWRVKVC